MTDQAALQKLFEAALKDNSDFNKPPTRLIPASSLQANSAQAPLPSVLTAEPEIKAVRPAPVVEAPATVPTQAGLDDATSNELKHLLDEQMARLSRKRRNASMATLALLFSLVGGGYAWFVQSPSRVEAYHSAIREVRSAGDLSAILAKYQIALDRIESRSANIDSATESMGVSSNQDDAQDVNFDAEMKAMMGGEGKTTGERNGMLSGMKNE